MFPVYLYFKISIDFLGFSIFQLVFDLSSSSFLQKYKLIDPNNRDIHGGTQFVLPKNYKPKIKNGRIDDTQFMELLQMKIGARVKLVNNIWTLDKLVNGSLGTIVGFEWRNDKNGKAHVVTVLIAFDEITVGEMQRVKYPRESKKYEDENGTPIFISEQEYAMSSNSGKSHAARAKVIQFPLRLAWASTAHGVQVISITIILLYSH